MAEERAWQGKTDGTSWMHRSLIKIMRVVPLRVMYVFATVFVLPFYLLFSKGTKPMYHFFRQRLGYAPAKACWGVCRNFHRFSQVILDKFYMFSGGKLEFVVENRDLYENLAEQEAGFLILSAHIGNYEVAGYTLKATNKRYNALVFAGEGEAVMQNRQKMFDGTNIHMILVKSDFSHIFAIESALNNGESVSIPSDRVVENQKTVACDFFGAPAKFPLGPFALAAQRDVAVLSIHVMKQSARQYHIFVKQLDSKGDSVRERASQYARQFANHVESIVRQYPEQWFNYYEFWQI